MRKLPLVRPHELIPFLVDCDAFPKIDPSEIGFYWNHMAQHAKWAQPCQGWNQTHPLYLWGDDAQYNKQREKVVAVALGFVLDDRRSSMDTIFPLFVYKDDPYMEKKYVFFCGVGIGRLAKQFGTSQKIQGLNSLRTWGRSLWVWNTTSLLEASSLRSMYCTNFFLSNFMVWTWHM